MDKSGIDRSGIKTFNSGSRLLSATQKSELNEENFSINERDSDDDSYQTPELQTMNSEERRALEFEMNLTRESQFQREQQRLNMVTELEEIRELA